MSGDRVDDGYTASIQPVPKAALQALYHAVTGKTENLSKRIKGNVVISYSDLEQLHLKLRQQAEHYDILARPTVTVVVKQENSRSLQYSSWEAFREFQTNATEITSEVSLKLEFIARVPNTPAPQRFIISVGLDSGLPVINSQLQRNMDDEFAGFFIFLARDFPTVDISIDFVDFLIAKIFSAVVEEWFAGLPKLRNSRSIGYLLDKIGLVHSVINQLGRVGISIFVGSYAFFTRNMQLTVSGIAYAIAICVFLWAILAVAVSYTNHSVTRKLAKGVIPSVILLTEGDTRAFDIIKNNKTSLYHVLTTLFLTSILSVILNVASSYIYTGLTNPK